MLFTKKCKQRFKKGVFPSLFVFIWVVLLSFYIYKSLYIILPSTSSELFFFSTETNDDFKYILCKELNKANNSIFLSSFGLQDENIKQIIEQKAASGVAVTISYDTKQPISIKENSGILLIPHNKTGLMHRKIISIDNELVFLGSFNLTLFSLEIHRNMAVAIRSAHILESIMKDEQFTSPLFQYIPLPKYKKEGLKKITDTIDNTLKRVYVAIYAITHKSIIEALITAKKRGVDVRIYVDNSMANGVCKKYISKFIDNDLIVKTNVGDGLLHHKCILADNNFILGSANFTSAAFSKNKEYIILFQPLDKVNLSKIENFFNNLNKSCTIKLTKK